MLRSNLKLRAKVKLNLSKMKTVDVKYAEIHFEEILEKVEQGENIIISKAGKPIAVLSPYLQS